eukprot:UN07167
MCLLLTLSDWWTSASNLVSSWHNTFISWWGFPEDFKRQELSSCQYFSEIQFSLYD